MRAAPLEFDGFLGKQAMVTDLNITDGFFEFAAKYPHATAVIDGDRPIRYCVLRDAVCLAAEQFRGAGWRAGDVVGVSFAGSQLLHLVTVLALARCGIAHAALPATDPAPLQRARIIRLGITGLVCDTALVVESGLPVVKPEASWLEPSAVKVADLRQPAADLPWVIAETSGTTAEPKVVGISHAIEHYCDKCAAPVYALAPGERFASLSGLRFLIGIKRAVRCVNSGATLVLPPAGVSYAELLRWLDLCGVTHLSCVPLHLHQMLADLPDDRPRLPALRILRCSSGAVPMATLEQVRRRLTPNLHVDYGSSEAGAMAVATPDILAEHPTSVGRPLAGIEFEIVDERGQPVPAGTPGRVRVRGPSVLTFYVRANAEDAAHVFRNGWCYPGDVAVKDEQGLVFLKGRADEMMNFDGIMVGPAEIESVLRGWPGVAEVAAFALPSTEHQDIPAAAIVSAQPLATDELARYCNDQLGVRAPRLFFRFDALPKNPMGKVLRRRLTELALAELRRQAPGGQKTGGTTNGHE